MNDKFEKDIVEAIESLKEQISEYKEQIEVVKNTDFNAPIDEDTWHKICFTSLRTSDLMGRLLKYISGCRRYKSRLQLCNVYSIWL